MIEVEAGLAAQARLAFGRAVDEVEEVKNGKAAGRRREEKKQNRRVSHAQSMQPRAVVRRGVCVGPRCCMAYFGSWLDLTMSRAVRPSYCAMLMLAPPSISACTQPS